MDGGAWQATVHRVSKSQRPPKQLSMHAHAWHHCKNATTSMKEYQATGLRFSDIPEVCICLFSPLVDSWFCISASVRVT